MIYKENILNRKVSFQKTAFNSLSHELTIKDVLNGIQKERLDDLVSHLRLLLEKGDNESYNARKKKLPGVTFCATFTEYRRRGNIKKYNEIIVIDIDKLTSTQLVNYKKRLKTDKYVFAFWESPSKKGLKGLVPLSYENDYANIDFAHRIAFIKLVDYFQSEYGIELDNSGSDTTRLCFMSSDKKIVIKESCHSFNIKKEDFDSSKSALKTTSNSKSKKVKDISRKAALFNPKGKNLPKNRATINSIIKFLTKRGLSITSDYDNWLRVAFAIANTFTHDIGEKYFLKICQLDGKKHNEIKSINLLISCYESTYGEIHFGTIFHLAQEFGYKVKKNKGDGSGDV